MNKSLLIIAAAVVLCFSHTLPAEEITVRSKGGLASSIEVIGVDGDSLKFKGSRGTMFMPLKDFDEDSLIRIIVDLNSRIDRTTKPATSDPAPGIDLPAIIDVTSMVAAVDEKNLGRTLRVSNIEFITETSAILKIFADENQSEHLVGFAGSVNGNKKQTFFFLADKKKFGKTITELKKGQQIDVLFRVQIVPGKKLPQFIVQGITDADQPIEQPVGSITNTLGMKFNKIPAGTFTMGSPETENITNDEHQHRVTISKAFYMQTTEVTQGQWKAVMGTEPWKDQEWSKYIKEGANYPAVYVNWDAVFAYCEKLSEKDGKTYRLPTEAEWEYACRAGTKTTWSFGNDEKEHGDYAWHDKNSLLGGEQYAHQVGLLKPNAFGLYDMHGNVYEWCNDYYFGGYYKQSSEKDPTGPESGSFRVLRGGCWLHDSDLARSANRCRFDAIFRPIVGFRLVRELD